MLATLSFATLRSAAGVTLITVVPVPDVPVEPGGRLTVAVLVMLPFAVALAWTWKVTVITPPEAIVTEPLMPVVPVVKLVTLALLVPITTLVTVPRPVGSVSMKEEPVAVLGPELLITRLKVSVPFELTVD
jgi:hypothetical protein